MGMEAETREQLEFSLAAETRKDWERAVPPVLVVSESKPPEFFVNVPAESLGEPARATLHLEDGRVHEFEIQLKDRPLAGSIEMDGRTWVRVQAPIPFDVPLGYPNSVRTGRWEHQARRDRRARGIIRRNHAIHCERPIGPGRIRTSGAAGARPVWPSASTGCARNATKIGPPAKAHEHEPNNNRVWFVVPITMAVAFPLLALDRLGSDLQKPFWKRSINDLKLDTYTTNIERTLLALLDGPAVGVEIRRAPRRPRRARRRRGPRGRGGGRVVTALPLRPGPRRSSARPSPPAWRPARLRRAAAGLRLPQTPKASSPEPARNVSRLTSVSAGDAWPLACMFSDARGIARAGAERHRRRHRDAPGLSRGEGPLQRRQEADRPADDARQRDPPVRLRRRRAEPLDHVPGQADQELQECLRREEDDDPADDPPHGRHGGPVVELGRPTASANGFAARKAIDERHRDHERPVAGHRPVDLRFHRRLLRLERWGWLLGVQGSTLIGPAPPGIATKNRRDRAPTRPSADRGVFVGWAPLTAARHAGRKAEPTPRRDDSTELS